MRTLIRSRRWTRDGCAGSNHVTTDIDFAISRDLENAKKVAEALAPFGPRPENFPSDLPYIWDAETVRRVTILTLLTRLGSVDLLGEAPGAPPFRTLKGRADQFEIYGYKVDVASIDDLIAMKQAANRAEDQGHITELLALKRLLAEQANHTPDSETSS